MSCPTCDHTMNCITAEGDAPLFWCPRCGTVSYEWDSEIHVPKLVSRCREFMNVAASASTPQTVAALHRLGVVESIYPPGRKA